MFLTIHATLTLLTSLYTCPESGMREIFFLARFMIRHLESMVAGACGKGPGSRGRVGKPATRIGELPARKSSKTLLVDCAAP